MENRFSLEELNNVAEVDIVYRKKVTCKISDRPQILQPSDAYEIFMHYWNADTIDLFEELKVIFMNRRNRVLQIITLSRGGIEGTVADPRLILITALKLAACSIVLAHNHPSGSLTPSKQDEALTQKIKYAAAYHDIKVSDHLIVTSDAFYSFAENGLV